MKKAFYEIYRTLFGLDPSWSMSRARTKVAFITMIISVVFATATMAATRSWVVSLVVFLTSALFGFIQGSVVISDYAQKHQKGDGEVTFKCEGEGCGDDE